MNYLKLIASFGIILLVFLLSTCKTDDQIINLEGSKFPTEVGKLLLTKCATPGCHNNISKDGASGLSLETWDDLFKGTRNGAAVIPYNHELSTLFLYTNHFIELGISNKPNMPIGDEPLTKDEVILLRDWIDKGAPNKEGFVKFSDNPKRKKFYVPNQGCDLVFVFDAESGLPMRAIKVGNSLAVESPHQVRVSADGKYWYVIFINGQSVQKYRCSDDTYVGQINIGFGNWNTLLLKDDNKHAFAVDFSSNGNIVYLDLENLVMLKSYLGANFDFPHGQAYNKNQDTLYLLSQKNNLFYKLDIADPLNNPDFSLPINFNGAIASLEAHDIKFSPDGNSYYITCQKTNEVRVYSRFNDLLIATILVGGYPQELSFSTTTDYLFITCMEDETTFAGKVGSVAVINYKTNTLVKSIYTGTQPHGIAVDDAKKLVYVANRNATTKGPAPHHTSLCGGRNGTVSVIDLNTLTLTNKKIEVSVDPYFVDIRN